MKKNGKTNLLQTGPKAGRGALGFIFSVVLLDVIGLAILMPVQAYIVRQYSDEALMVAMIPVIYAAAQFFAAPLLGKLSDRYGRRPVLLISILGSALGYFLFGIGGALWVLFLSRLIDGFTAGNASTSLRLCCRCDTTTGPCQELWFHWDGVWVRVHPWPGAGRLAQ